MKALWLAGLAGLAGCGQQPFRASGSLTSDGGRLGRWHSGPVACTRDPFDGAPDGRTKSVATLLWENPGRRNPKLGNWENAPDAPTRLQIARDGAAVEATLYTVHTGGARMDATVCARLELETREQAAQYPEGRPTLAGSIALDCVAGGDHVSGAVSFERCEY